MNCKFCRNELPEDAKFCPVCGTPVEAEEPAQEVATEEIPEGQYQYGIPNQDQTQYQYGTPNQDQTQYQYGTPNQDQTQYQYGTPNQDQTRYQYGTQKQLSSTPYMIFAILSTLFCCVPFGIASIVFASKISSRQRAGDYAGAQEAAKKARLFSIISAVIGIIVFIVGIIASVAMGVVEESSAIHPYDESIVEEWDDDDDEKAASVPPAEQSSDLGAAWEDYTVQLNDTVLTLPCTIEELESVGFKMDTDYLAEDYVVNVDEYELGYFEDQNDNEIMVYLANETDQAKTIRECTVSGISVSAMDLEEGGLTIIFPSGIQMGTDIDTVVAAYGEADDVYEGDSVHMYTWYGSEEDYGKYCEIDVDSNTKLVTDMTMACIGE